MSKRNSNFVQLKKLADRIETSIQKWDDKDAEYSKEKLIRSGGYKLMDGLIRNTPIATPATNPHDSNWFTYTYQPTQYGIGYGFERGTKFGDVHYRGTLARGWVSSPMDLIDRPPNRKPTLAEGKTKVDETEVVRKGKRQLSMKFVNAAPFSQAVELGHINKVPKILGGDGSTTFKYTPGRYFTDKTVQEYSQPISVEIEKEYTKMVRNATRAQKGWR